MRTESNAYGDLPDFEYNRNEGLEGDASRRSATSSSMAATVTRSVKRPATNSRSFRPRPPAAAARRGRRSPRRAVMGARPAQPSLRRSTRTSRSRPSASRTSCRRAGQHRARHPDRLQRARPARSPDGSDADCQQPGGDGLHPAYIERYGYLSDGVRTGDGTVGFGSQFDDNDFYRNEVKFGYNLRSGTESSTISTSGISGTATRRIWSALERLGTDHDAGWQQLTDGAGRFVRAQVLQQGLRRNDRQD